MAAADKWGKSRQQKATTLAYQQHLQGSEGKAGRVEMDLKEPLRWPTNSISKLFTVRKKRQKMDRGSFGWSHGWVLGEMKRNGGIPCLDG